MKKDYIIAVDGPSGAGKSTVSQKLAERLGYLYIDTGAMYRAAALKAMRAGLDLDNGSALEKIAGQLEIELVKNQDGLKIMLDGEDVSQAIRGPDMGMAASKISRHLLIREKMWELQRRLARKGGVVAEGRDVGTVVFPNADFKFFVTASVQERARRRYQELQQRGFKVRLDEILAEVEARDRQDSERELSPLKPAKDSILIDTTSLNVEQAVERILQYIED